MIGRGVCAIDLSADSERELLYAKDAALAAKSDLSLIQVIEASKVQSEAQRPSDEERKALQRIAELQRRVGSEFSVHVASGPIRETLLDQVRQAAADVLVIGRSLHGATGRLRVFPMASVRDSPCPAVGV